MTEIPATLRNPARDLKSCLRIAAAQKAIDFPTPPEIQAQLDEASAEDMRAAKAELQAEARKAEADARKSPPEQPPATGAEAPKE